MPASTRVPPSQSDLRISAREASGGVQAIQQRTQRFALGLQWHLQYLLQRREPRALLRQPMQAAVLETA